MSGLHLKVFWAPSNLSVALYLLVQLAYSPLESLYGIKQVNACCYLQTVADYFLSPDHKTLCDGFLGSDRPFFKGPILL